MLQAQRCHLIACPAPCARYMRSKTAARCLLQAFGLQAQPRATQALPAAATTLSKAKAAADKKAGKAAAVEPAPVVPTAPEPYIWEGGQKVCIAWPAAMLCCIRAVRQHLPSSACCLQLAHRFIHILLFLRVVP